ncbi:putative EIF4e-like protein [Trypanosoma vivax]|nr:putative EIF4e-like protein [Trypanosoma vivax]
MQTRLKSRPDEPRLVVQVPQSSTQLWGVWEMWCVVPEHARETPSAADSRSWGGGKWGSAQKRTAKKATWLDQVRSVGLFDTAEGFWGIVSCTLTPSQLLAGFTYYLFRRNIAPIWEHEANRRGGRWIASFQQTPHALESATKGGSAADAQRLSIDEAWESLCTEMIAEQIPCDETEICGVAVRRRERGHAWKLSLWTRNALDSETQIRIGEFVKKLLNLDDGALQYLVHRELMQAGEDGCLEVPPLYQL